MRVRIIIVITLVLAIAGGVGTAGASYWKKQVEQEKVFLQERVAILYKKNKDLKEKVSNLAEKNSEYIVKIKKQEVNTLPSEILLEIPDEEQVRQQVRKDLQKNKLYSKFVKIEVDTSLDWARAEAVSKNQANKNLFYILQRVNLRWKILKSGNDLKRSDFPDSPWRIW